MEMDQRGELNVGKCQVFAKKRKHQGKIGRSQVRSQGTMPVHGKERRTLNAQALWICFTSSAFNVV